MFTTYSVMICPTDDDELVRYELSFFGSMEVICSRVAPWTDNRADIAALLCADSNAIQAIYDISVPDDED